MSLCLSQKELYMESVHTVAFVIVRLDRTVHNVL